ncbi:tRNA-5-taurinomethyluridine 2-sulfurtransferase [Paragonimus westermani]|uniref:tRNA-5-taurinomethyluridine 2-sulfurtransferase n=1 Tax=Paragonimus westermani TaxID=34504 RepID=A0A5J4NK52_9TREM|nr:tRNA-5-taurinomethyluridine 2-sulfurtransferase [Paragonimus westermani]
MTKLIRSVACAISGGVDSAVSAYLLKKNGFDVTGVFMTNWDSLNEGVSCSLSSDRDDAKLVCERLDIPFRELNFVREYWIYVFHSFSFSLLLVFVFVLLISSEISHRHLQHFMFPVGGLLKPTVKKIAADIGLQAIAARRESMGMCFIGKRRFSDFIESVSSRVPTTERFIISGGSFPLGSLRSTYSV